MKRIFALAMVVAVGMLVANTTLLYASDYALSFDGTNAFVQATPAGWQTNAGVTVEAWIYRTARAATSNQNASAVSKSASGASAWTNPGEWNLGWGWANDAIFRCYAISNTWPAYLVPNDGDLNQWHHLAGVIDGAANQVRLYVDGVLQATAAANRVEGTNATPVWIGRTGTEYTPGYVDEVRLWKMARSTTDIANNWNRRLSGTESNLVAYWRCDEGAGSSIFDKTSNGFTGTLSNGASFAASTVPMTNVLTVTSTADSSNDSVRAALLSAVDGDTINITATGTVLLPYGTFITNQQLIVTKSVSIIGPGPAQFAIACNGQGRVFNIQPNLVVTITGLAINNGSLCCNFYGGGVYNDHSTLTLSNCTFTGHQASGNGGAIYNNGGAGGTATLRLIQSIVSSNSVTGYGGAIVNDGTGNGSTATVEIVESTIAANSCSQSGGGIYNNGGAQGDAVVTILNSTLLGNSANSRGGGLFNDAASGSASLTVSNSTFTGNFAGNAGGAYANNFTSPGGQVNATFINSTLSSNNAHFTGGAVYQNGSGATVGLTIRNCTLSGNAVTNTGSGIAGGIYNQSATTQIGNTILNAGSAGVNLYDGGFPFGISSLGYNISSDGGGNVSGGFLTATGDQTNTNPQLGPLQYNGGPTPTHALLPNSPAIDAGDPTLTSGYDQRGVGYPRAVANNYTGIPRADIGAFEAATIDTIGDGIPDSWRAHYFGGSGAATNNQSCATCDATGTGQDNLFKYTAGLNPTNPASIFQLRIAEVPGQPSQESLLFDPIVAGRTYAPEYRPDLVSGSYTNLTGFSGPTTNGNQATITDLTAIEAAKFYRVHISLP